MAKYPKRITLKNNKIVEIRYLRQDDFDDLFSFFKTLPEEDRLFLRRDVTDPKIVQEIIKESKSDNVAWLVAESQGKIVAEGTIFHPQFGWMRHVGELRLVVARPFRHKGMGSILARELFMCAVGMGVEKVIAKAVEEQATAVRCMEKLGFHQEAVLKGYVRDLRQLSHNMLIMSQEI